MQAGSPIRPDKGKHLLPFLHGSCDGSADLAALAALTHKHPHESASASQAACYKWKKIGARVASTAFDLWAFGSDVASILSSGSRCQMTKALGLGEKPRVAMVEKKPRRAQPLSPR